VTRILDFGFISSRLILIVQRGVETLIEAIDVEPGGVDDNSNFITHLDRRFMVDVPNLSGVDYDPYEDHTYIPMEIDVSTGGYLCVTAGSTNPGALRVGLQVEVVEAAPDHIVVRGNLTKTPLHFGILYTKRYRLSDIFIRQQSQSGGTTVLSEGRLQLLQLIFLYSKTAYFRIEVTPLAQATRSYVTNGRMMGDPENKVDTVTLSDGTCRVPILSKNDRVQVDIVNDSYLPSSLLSVEWIGSYTAKSRRI
jgi:hypothetical protein